MRRRDDADDALGLHTGTKNSRFQIHDRNSTGIIELIKRLAIFAVYVIAPEASAPPSVRPR
jgi:hypothetical protein